MADPADELIDYEEDDETVQITNGLLKHDSTATSGTAANTPTTTSTSHPEKATTSKSGKGYVGIHSTGFRDFLLKPELLHAIADCGFEHPSEGLQMIIYLFLP
jgi:hypothetical protein